MSIYKYVVTNALTGTVMSDNCPLIVSSMSRAISGVGKLDGYLPLRSAKGSDAFVRALVADQSMIWVLQDNYPIWCGIYADSNHTTIKDNRLPITAYTPESILAARQIRGALTFTNQDVYVIGRGIVGYAFSPDRGPNAGLSGLMLGTSTAGVLDSETFGVSNTLVAGGNTYTGAYSSNTDTGSALSTYAQAQNLEYEFAPRLSGSTLQIAFRIRTPGLGRYNFPAITLLHPGVVGDYARPIMRSQSANDIQGSASANGTGSVFVSQPGHGLDATDLSGGHILRQTSVQWPGSGAITQAQVNQWTDAQVTRLTAGTMVPSLVLEGDRQPRLTQLGLGDALDFAATSDRDPADPKTGAPGLQLTARMTSWVLQPPGPNGQEEKLTINLGALIGQTAEGKVGTT